MVKPRIVLLIFVSGKVVLTGKDQLHLLFVLETIRFSFNVTRSTQVFVFVVSEEDFFHSIPGAKERAEIYEAFENIYPILRGFKKQ